MDERVCPECGAEYLPHVVDCPHCEVPTRNRLELPSQQAAAGRDLALGAGAEAVALRTAPLAWARELAAFLADHGVPSRIGQVEDCGPSCSDRCAVLVRAEDLQRAVRLDQEHLSRQVPETFADLADLPGDRCPACGAAVGEGEGECSDCGLALG